MIPSRVSADSRLSGTVAATQNTDSKSMIGTMDLRSGGERIIPAEPGSTEKAPAVLRYAGNDIEISKISEIAKQSLRRPMLI